MSNQSFGLYTNITIFCDDYAVKECNATPIYLCGHCRISLFVLLLTYAVILGLAIFIGNALVFAAFCSRGKTSSTHHMLKASLAVADTLSVLILFCMTIPNVIRTMLSTPVEMQMFTLASVNSPSAKAGAILFNMTWTTLLTHYVFLSYDCFACIKWPLLNRNGVSTKKRVLVKIFVIWSSVMIYTSYSTWFPESFISAYETNIFVFVNVARTSRDLYIFIITTIVVGSLLFITLTAFTTGTGILIWRHERRFRSLRGVSETVFVSKMKRAFFTLLFMELGFTISLFPIITIVVTIADGVYPREANVVYVYVSMLNSLVNVVIYNFRDEQFKEFLGNLKRNLLCNRN
uniref:lysophosphatidic acid receptor 3-like n=1 Tax=Ciona intestinalis TaxID=7719 RepID=UPI000EF46825|nr:lysophosphatidic acid receptor 3-like [Ciona intestinalis]|eukprot:XP_026690414.1 lysophosphatidic acid receptor 3-like [Ciona intestinalis]